MVDSVTLSTVAGSDDGADEDVFVFPASFAQQRLWFLDQFEPNSSFYNIATAVRLRGRLRAPVLERALNEIVRRHESLRTTFDTEDEQPVQVIRPRGSIALPLVDLTALPEAEREAEAKRLGDREAQQPFDLKRGPLLRAQLLRLEEEDHVALLTMHHIISDGWSMGVLIREIVALYTAFDAGRPSPLPELPIQYADYAQWQRDWLQGEVLQRQIDYWKAQLGDQPPVLELPGDRPRPAVQTSRGGSVTRGLERGLVQALEDLSRREGVTLFMTLLAAFQALLARYSGEGGTPAQDICVGTPIANRTRGELEGLIGFFVNTLVLRANLAGDPTFRELLRRVREVSLGAYAHQDLPFEMLVEAIQPERDMSHTPLFQVMFILQNATNGGAQAPGAGDLRSATPADPDALVMSTMETETGTSTFDLTLSMAQVEDGMAASVEYSTDLFDRETVERLLEHLETLLCGVVADPEQRLSRLPLATEGELRRILVEWNDTAQEDGRGYAPDGPRPLLVHELFEAQARRTPSATAIVDPAAPGAERRLSYGQLAARAARLARALVDLGVGPEALVGLCFERSPEMLVGVLGVLQAGGAYVPLDPGYPQERLATMLEDARVEVLVTQQHLLAALPPLHGPRIVLLEPEREPLVLPPDPLGESEGLAPSGTSRPGAVPGLDNLAYVIFTSGSTGRPKGVMIEHGSLRNAYLAWEEAYELHSVRAHLQMASFSFDVFTGDWTRALCSGGKLVLAPRELLLEPQALYDLMRREEIDCAEFVPVVLRGLMQYLAQTGQRLDFMRLVLCGSDSWYVGEYRQFQRLCGPRTRLINSFGLTEATIDSTYFESRPVEDPRAGDALDATSAEQLIPIGRPFANTKIYILDQQMQPVPIGVPGELYVGGAGLARGYLRAASPAGEGHGNGAAPARRVAHDGGRFIPNPFAGAQDGPRGGASPRVRDASSRLYRTGDGARYRRDGHIEFLGRIDDQVKVRGYRIELGEVEAALNQHPEIEQSAAVAREGVVGGKLLVGYIVPLSQPGPGAGALRRFMQERLPDYMVPSLFVPVPSIPVTPNGKIDRRSLAARPLPPMAELDRGAEEDYVAPRTPFERGLAEFWADILEIPADKIGLRDNFFALGGHSLLATQVVSRVRDAWQIDLPLRVLFEAPVLAALAEQIEVRAQAAAPQLQAPPLRPAPRAQDLPLSFAQQRLWFLDQLEPNSPFYNMPEAVRLSGKLDRSILEQSLNEVVRRHESLRTSFLTVDGKPRQVIAPPAPVTLQMVDLRSVPAHQRDAEVDRLVRAESQQPFNLARGPLWRARLLRLDEDEHVLLLVIHHIISDDWSSNVLFSELVTFYEAFTRGGSWPLPDLPLQYADYAVWQRGWLQGEVLQAHLDYWERRLQGIPPLLQLPTDRPRPAVQTFAGAYRSFALPEDLSRDVQALSRREGVTLFMTLLAAFQVLLSRYSGEAGALAQDICVGTPIANRTRSELEPLIGFFVNTLVLRGDLSGDPTFRQLLQRTREAALGAYAHQDLPFEMIVDRVQPRRDMSHSPLFQVMFVLRNAGSTVHGSSGERVASQTGGTSGLRIAPVEAHSGTSKFDLTLFVVDEEERLSGALEYNTDLFDAETIAQLLDHWRNLLQGIVAHPDEHVSRLPLMGRPELERLLVEWNNTSYPCPAVCAHQLFEAQAARTPDAVAVTVAADPLIGCPQRSLTYRELNRRANQLARYLMGQGVGPDVLVGVCVRRALELPVALLGVLKAGGAYVPLDPTYPQERLAFMLGDMTSVASDMTSVASDMTSVASAPILLTQTALLEQLPAQEAGLAPSRVVCLDALWPDTPRPDAARLDEPLGGALSVDDINPTSEVTPDHLAYVIYTSGSTGQPKGALIVHRGLVNYLTWCRLAYPLDDGQGAPVHSSISFDLTVTSLFAPLVSGRRVDLLPEDLGLDALAEALRRNGRYSLVKITPAHLELLGQQVDPARAPGATRSFIIGGENLLPEHIAFWQASAPDTVLVNEYGPTETVVGCCVYSVPRVDDDAGEGATSPAGLKLSSVGAVPIGRPIINTQLYVLDSHMQPVPIGVVGELYIGGAGVARGYLNRPALTAERFVLDPFAVARESGAAPRLYKTGDLARYRRDGNLECLGRIDHQVKIRGFRVELGEIEAVLSRYPGLSEVCVVAREDAPGARRLVAYVAAHSDAGLADTLAADKPSAPEIKAFLAAKLPEYMVPSVIVFLDALPLTANGKVDRRALPAPESLRPDVGAAYVAPRDSAEETLARIWSELLHLDRVGVYDNFFELGGDSIISIQVIARANQAGLRLAPKDLFQHPTIDGLAAASRDAQSGDDSLRAIRAEQGLVVGEVPLTPIQRWFLEGVDRQDIVQPNHWNQALLLPSEQRLDRALLERAVEHLLEHHDALRLRLTREAPNPLSLDEAWRQVSAEREDAPVFSWVDLSATPPRRQQAAIAARAAALQASLDLSRGPLLRVAYFDLGPRAPGRLLIAVHHLAIDGVSWAFLLEDLQAAYQQLARRDPVRLPSKTTSFREWAETLVEYASSAPLQEELAFWLGRAGADTLPEKRDRSRPSSASLPVDNPAGENVEGSAKSVTISLDNQETHALLHKVHSAYHTEINDLLLTALAQALSVWAGASQSTTAGRSILVDLEGHGREPLFDDVDLSRTVGWFTTLYPLLVTLRHVDDPGDCLKIVKETLRQVPRHGLGYGLLRYLGPAEARRALSAMPRAEISFNYLGQSGAEQPSSGLLGSLGYGEGRPGLAAPPDWLAPSQDARGPDRGLRNKRTHLIDVNGGVSGGRLSLEWSYSENVYRRATIEKLAAEYKRRLLVLIAHCQSQDAGGLTASDMADFGWGKEELGDILRELGDLGDDLRELRDDLDDAFDDLADRP